MNLSELDPGLRFTVARVRLAGEMGRRLADMGFTEGSAGRMVREGWHRPCGKTIPWTPLPRLSSCSLS